MRRGLHLGLGNITSGLAVSGLAALVLSSHPELSATEIKDCIVTAAVSNGPAIVGETFHIVHAPSAVQYAPGVEHLVLTDDQWKTLELSWAGGLTSAEPNDWQISGFDDSGWSDAYIPPDPSQTGTYEGAGPFAGPAPPVVADDGTMFLVSEENGTTVYGLDAAGHVIAGWPYRDAIGLQWSRVPEGDVGTPSWRSEPVVGPSDVLYLLHPPRVSTVGGSIVAIGSDGRVRPGWPVGLKRAGAEFSSVVVGSDGTAYALAVEPEAGDAFSASILAIAPDSTVIWTTTIIEP